MRTIVCILSMFLFVMCGNKGKVQTLSEEEEKEEPTNLYLSEVIMDTVPPPPGIRYKEERSVRPSQPVKRIDLTKHHSEKEVDMGDYYSSVRFITLRHPRAEEGIGFLADVSYYITLNSWIYGDRGFFSFIQPCDGRIIAGDKFFGYQSYTLTGEFEKTIVCPENAVNYNAAKRSVTMVVDNELSYLGAIMGGRSNAIEVLGDNCVYVLTRNGKQYVELYNLSSGKVYQRKPLDALVVTLLNAETIVSYNYDILNRDRGCVMYSFSLNGDTLCRFTNYNQLAVSAPNTYSNPQQHCIYHYDDLLTIWQPYNDTVFRMTSAHELIPVYTVNPGDRKLDMETALYGKKDGKLIPGAWLETPDFIYLNYSEGSDSPNNRKSGNVKFHYAMYKKASDEMSMLPQSCFPEEVLFNNSTQGGIPLLVSGTKYYKNRLYTAYSKYSLDIITKSPAFASFPGEQQEKIKQLHNDLSETDLLIMIME